MIMDTYTLIISLRISSGDDIFWPVDIRIWRVDMIMRQVNKKTWRVDIIILWVYHNWSIEREIIAVQSYK